MGWLAASISLGTLCHRRRLSASARARRRRSRNRLKHAALLALSGTSPLTFVLPHIVRLVMDELGPFN